MAAAAAGPTGPQAEPEPCLGVAPGNTPGSGPAPCPDPGAPPLLGAGQPGHEAAAPRGGQGAGSMPPPPPKCGGAGGSPLATAPAPSLGNSSQREALTAPPSTLLLSSEAGEERDEYLLRLLRKPALPMVLHPQQQVQQLAPQPPAPPPSLPADAGFRAPGPVARAAAPSVPAPASAAPAVPARMLSRATSGTLASPSCIGHMVVPTMQVPAPSGATTGTGTATDQAVPTASPGASGRGANFAASMPPGAAAAAAARAAQLPRPPPYARGAAAAAAAAAAPAPAVPVPAEVSGTFAVTRKRLGDEMAYFVRDTMIRQQVMFLEQLYDLHRAIAIQKLLMQNCPEVQQVMGEAMRLMSSVGSQHGSGSGRGSKRQRTTPNGGGATVPGSGSGADPSSFRPDSQFAAVPQLPGEAQTCGDEEEEGGSGDPNGSGSGQNGSGGGSTSPQHQPVGLLPMPHGALPYMYLAHTAVATPSGASAAPQGWQWGVPPGALGPNGQQVQQVQQSSRGLPPVPQGPPQMAPWVGQDAGLAAVGMNTHPPQQHGQGAAAMPARPNGGKATTSVRLPPARAVQPAAAAAQPAAAQPAAAQPAAAAAAAAQPGPQPAAASAVPAAAPAPAAAPPAMAAGGMAPPPGMPFAPAMMMVPPGAGMPGPSHDPLSWWYQNYYGAAAFQAQQHTQQMGGMSLATAQAAAVAAAALMPPPPPGGAAGCTTLGANATGTATATKWWHDAALTFGPPADADMLARRPAGGLAALAAGARDGPEVQSAPAGEPKRPAESQPPRRGGLYSEGRMKRKAAADADEASSGTTGHTHDHGPPAQSGGVVSPARAFKRQESLRARAARAAPREATAEPMAAGGQDANAAELLLAIGKQ